MDLLREAELQLRRVDELVGKPSEGLEPLMASCLQLAALLDEKEWELLFNLNLFGYEKDLKRRERWIGYDGFSRKPEWDAIKVFIEDRKGEPGLEGSYGHSVAELEELLRQGVGLSEGGYNDETLTKSNFAVRAAIRRSRARAVLFASHARRRLVKLGLAQTPQRDSKGRVFIGHGRSNAWKELREFLEQRLGLQWDEFNRESPAGIATVERLQTMLSSASFAFLVLTAEDHSVDGSARARENVVHEAGLFQGCLGFRRAIVVLEDGCNEFSNIAGLGQIRFPRGSLESKFEEIRRVLEREAVIPGTPGQANDKG